MQSKMMSKAKRQKSADSYRLLYGTCPDEECQAKLYFPSHDNSIECTSCGQRHEKSALKNIAEVTNPDVALHNLLKNVLLGNVKPKKGADSVKVLGLSNYVCKLISPILTLYGMDRETGKAKLLSEMGKGEVFDVSILGDRAFLIEEENLNVIGFGKDRSGSMYYLSDTLTDISVFNDEKETLVPIHADGDGHCLVHAISRALVGRELFWHALRVNLKNHLISSLDEYKELFKEFVDKDEWDCIIDECDPYYIPPESEALGLRNIHIFGLANILHRPIILLDSKTGMSSSGDYSGVFLPGLIPPEQCKGKDGSLNKPLCIAWSSSGHNHYIPVVAIKGRGPAKLPKYMVKKSWGMPEEEIEKYIEFDNMHRCTVGGDKCLTDKYLLQLVSTMEEKFKERYDVNPGLVADVHQYIYKSTGIVGVLPDEVIERTQNAVAENKLYRCLMCDALVEYVLSVELFEKNGSLYKLAVSIHNKLDPNKLYSFPAQGAVCSYDETKDCLIPDMEKSCPRTCAFCSGDMIRRVSADASVVYMDGDKTATRCVGGRCPCGYKHFWQGKEYDNLPEVLPISLSWGGKMVEEKVAWFQHESDPALNSNVFEVAQGLVQKHFPGEFGSERLVQRVVDTILYQTAAAVKDETPKDCDNFNEEMDTWSAETASKIILTGQKKKTIHREELTMSEKEKKVQKQIQANAPKMQQKKTASIAATTATQKVTASKKKDAESVKQSDASSKPMDQSGTEPVASTSSKAQSASAGKKIRLATSDGRQAMLTLSEDVTYSQLQKLIFESVDVAADRQKIRVGFPPKILEAPKDGEEECVVPLHHGDKLAVEVIPDTTHAHKQPVQEMSQSHPPPASKHSASWSSFEEDAQSQNAEHLLQALKEAQHAGDSIDTSIASLGILSAVAGKDLWTYVQSMPHLFSIGGLLYNQVKRDLGLVDGKHCQLPCLPGKIFRYNGTKDRLELCLEPYGHFPVEPNVEYKVKESGMKEGGPGHKEEVKFGSFSGAITHGHERKAFSGQGHSLIQVDARMPADLACAGHRPQARGFHDLCGLPGRHQDSISEEPDSMQVDDITTAAAPQPQVKYQRLGPGYTVIDQSTTNRDNANLEMIRALAESIEKTLSQDMEDDIQKPDQETVPLQPVDMEPENTVTMDTSNTKTSGMNLEKTDTVVKCVVNTDESKGNNDTAVKESSIAEHITGGEMRQSPIKDQVQGNLVAMTKELMSDNQQNVNEVFANTENEKTVDMQCDENSKETSVAMESEPSDKGKESTDATRDVEAEIEVEHTAEVCDANADVVMEEMVDTNTEVKTDMDEDTCDTDKADGSVVELKENETMVQQSDGKQEDV